jgi:hypothetical protein
VPEHGTVVQKQVLPGIDDDDLIRARLRRCFGPDADIRFGQTTAGEGAAPGTSVAKSSQPATQ